MRRRIHSTGEVAVAIALGSAHDRLAADVVTSAKRSARAPHLSQGGSAELVAMTTIFAADSFGLPVSTTHVLSSASLARWRRTAPLQWGTSGTC